MVWGVILLFFASDYITIKDSSSAVSAVEVRRIKDANLLGYSTLAYIIFLIVINALDMISISKRLDYYDVFIRCIILSIAAFMGLTIYSKYSVYII